MSSVGSYSQRRVARPRRRHHDRRARGDAVAQRAVHADVGGVARAEVVARDDDQLGVVVVAETFGECGHRAAEAIRYTPAHRPMLSLVPQRRRVDELVGVGDVRRNRQRARVSLRMIVRLTNCAVAGEVHVGQHPAEVVAGHDVAFEVKRRVLRQQRLRELRRLRAVALHRRVGLLRLRSVDADQAHSFAVAADADVDRVAVDDRDHRRVDGECGWNRGGCRHVGSTGGGQHGSNRTHRDDDLGPSTATRSTSSVAGAKSSGWTLPRRRNPTRRGRATKFTKSLHLERDMVAEEELGRMLRPYVHRRRRTVRQTRPSFVRNTRAEFDDQAKRRAHQRVRRRSTTQRTHQSVGNMPTG